MILINRLIFYFRWAQTWEKRPITTPQLTQNIKLGKDPWPLLFSEVGDPWTTSRTRTVHTVLENKEKPPLKRTIINFCKISWWGSIHLCSVIGYLYNVDDVKVDDNGADDDGVEDKGVKDDGVDDDGVDDDGVNDEGVEDEGSNDDGVDDDGVNDDGVDDDGVDELEGDNDDVIVGRQRRQRKWW